MKDELQSNGTFNATPGVRSRGPVFGVVAAGTLGILLMATGAVMAEVRWSIGGLAVLSVATVAWRLWRRRETAPIEAALELFSQSAPDEARGRQLLELLEAWECLETKRGTPDFDPWALQVLRNDIRKLVDSDPGLSRLFSELQRAA